MGISNDILLDLWNWLSLNSSLGFLLNGVFVASIGGNIYLFKKLNELNKSEAYYIDLLKKIEPLLEKIIDKKKFEIHEIEDAKTIRNIIKFNTKKC